MFGVQHYGRIFLFILPMLLQQKNPGHNIEIYTFEGMNKGVVSKYEKWYKGN